MKNIEPSILLSIFFGFIIVFVLLTPFFGHHGGIEKPHPPTCTSKQRKIIANIQMYAQDHEEVLPLSSNVWNKLKEIDKAVLICPEDKNSINSYLFNNNLSGVEMGSLEDPSTMMATVDGKTTISKKRKYNNVYYTPTDVLYRHYIKEKKSYYAVASYIDGHAEIVNKITEPESWDKPIVQKKTGVKK